ncbi:MAG: hypothetical protein KDB00_07490 [Planctomycetales bacterium]|nr:hypothetical protein [Planctomycetales bacterium]
MNVGFVTLLVGGLALSALVGWKSRSLIVFLSVLVLILGMLAVIPTGTNTPVAVSKSISRTEPSSPPSTNQETSKDLSPLNEGPVTSPKVTLTTLEEFRPKEVPTLGYVGSDACIECHAENHSSWVASYHSKMTQVAAPQTVIGDFNDVTIVNQGRQYRFYNKDGIFYVDMPDEHDATKRFTAPIVLTTGSHHMQVYWFATGKRRLVGMLPLVYLRDSQEWVPRESAFLVPPHHGPSFEMGRWNETCSSCHSTNRKERRLASGEWDTHVGEFGISCEACHGPGSDHLQYHRNLSSDSVAKDSTSGTDGGSNQTDPIVNPASLTKERSAQVCGQCHSVSDVLAIDESFEENGHDYRPGKDLSKTHAVWRRDAPEHKRTMEALDYPDLETLLNETYYPDGMIRVSGREYNGLIESSCYIDGEMTCLSCHKLHKSNSDNRSLDEWANDQLNALATGNHACTQCHQGEQYGTSHTHHAAESTGSKCYNCHMPHTAYGLLKSIRNHQISSPNVARDRDNQRPNACNLCHLDQTMQWSANHLEQWYGIEPPELTDEEKEIAASLIWLLKGNAAERAISAWHMGWKDAQQASGDDWQLPFLAALLDDEYEAIRLIARRTIRSLPGTEKFELDVVTSSTSQQREQRGFELLNAWLKKETTKEIDRPELLISQKLGIDVAKLRGLIDRRDNTRVLLSE